MRVGQMVRELVGSCSSVVHSVRAAAVMALVEGIVQGGRLSPATIGRALSGGALPKHSIKRVDRLLGNPKMVGDRVFFFKAIALRLLRQCARPVVLVDWTQAGQHVALVAAVPIGGRALRLRIPPTTQNGQVFRLKGHGMPAVGKPDDVGDLYATVDVELPRELTAEQQAHFEELRKLEKGTKNSAA